MIAASDSYRHLRARAADLVAAAGGQLDAATLSAALFGSAARAVSQTLLDAVLGDDDRFERRDASWSLIARRAPIAGVECSVLAVALATTGTDPRRHRIVRLAAVRSSPDGVIARLDLVLSPGRRLPRYLVDAARLSVDEVAEAPAFPEVAAELREFVGEDDFYSYGAGWVRAFLDAEHARADLLGLPNRVVEIDELGRGLIPHGRKPELSALADALGLVHPRPGVPPVDAEVAARVVLALRDRPTPPRDASSGAPTPEISTVSPRPLLSRAWLATIPSSPGVYWMADEAGAVLYVGKAVDLRRRLSAYLGRAPGMHRRLEGLSTRAAKVEVSETPSDLEATLLEARLLAEHSPPFNVARLTHRPASYIRIAPSDSPPRVRLVREPAVDGASYVGPLKSARVAQQTVAVARAAFPEAFLRRTVDAGRQRAAVIAVSRLLGGQKEAALASLRAAMGACASAGDQAGIDRARVALRAVQDLTIEPSALIGLGEQAAALIVERVGNGDGRAHLVTKGQLIGSADVDLSTWSGDPHAISTLARFISAAAPEPTPETAVPGESSLISRWLAQSRSVVGVYRVPT